MFGRPGNVIFTSQEKKRDEEEKGELLLFCLPSLFFAVVSSLRLDVSTAPLPLPIDVAVLLFCCCFVAPFSRR